VLTKSKYVYIYIYTSIYIQRNRIRGMGPGEQILGLGPGIHSDLFTEKVPTLTRPVLNHLLTIPEYAYLVTPTYFTK